MHVLSECYFCKANYKSCFLSINLVREQIIFDTVFIFFDDGKSKNLRIKFKIQLIVNKTWLLSDLLLKTKWFILLRISKKKSYKKQQNDYEKWFKLFWNYTPNQQKKDKTDLKTKK